MKSPAGFSGWNLGMLAGAVFEDSPLLARRGTVSAGVAITWVIGESPRRVEADE